MSEKGCPHCLGGFGLKYPLLESERFLLVCDVHPLAEGHILLIPKEHITCAGALPEASFAEYKVLYEKILSFLNKTYGRTAVFEHGITGQTVFHAHTHFLPFTGSIHAVVPEKDCPQKISSLDELKSEFDKTHKYLFVAIDSDKWLVDTKIGFPRFFRDRFAKALGTEERGNWKEARNNSELMKTFEKDIQKLKSKWKLFSTY